MEQLTVGLGERSYPILIGNQCLDQLPEALSNINFPKRVAIISNPTVADLYAAPLRDLLTTAGYRTSLITMADGEEFKTLQSLSDIYDALLTERYDRHSGIIALGGGVVGDLSGFAAATFLRGIPFVQIPTTLLAQVDSSVGGKTAVNHPLGKNLIGAFYQPRLVFIDVATLKTLPTREFSAGLAEVVKYGIIRDRTFFRWLQTRHEQLVQQQPAALIHAVKTACQIKANVVEIDETESSLRAILNYGHTFGHAIENLAGYGRYRHGEAVAIGMVVASTLACQQGLCQAEDVAAIRSLLQSLGLPVVPPDIAPAEYVQAMERDKKARDGRITFILNQGIGDCAIVELSDPETRLTNALLQLKESEG